MKSVIQFLKIKRLLIHFWIHNRISRSSYHTWTRDSSNAPLSYTSDDATDNILIKFHNYPSINKIKQNFKQVIKDLKRNKSADGDIPTRLLK